MERIDCAVIGAGVWGRPDDPSGVRTLERTGSLDFHDNGLTTIELSVAFALNHPAVSSVIIGPRTAEHLEAYLKAATVQLGDDVLDQIDQIVDPGTHFVERDTGRDTPSLQPAALRRNRR